MRLRDRVAVLFRRACRTDAGSRFDALAPAATFVAVLAAETALVAGIVVVALAPRAAAVDGLQLLATGLVFVPVVVASLAGRAMVRLAVRAACRVRVVGREAR